MRLTAIKTCNDTELFAGHNWKQLGAILISLLLLLVIGIGLWWMLDSESKSQLTLVLSSEYMSVYTTHAFLINLCVYILIFMLPGQILTL